MRIIFFALSFIVLLLVAAVVGPSFVDWNKYKEQIVTQVQNATGLDVQINGDLSLAVLPSPRVKIEDLIVVSPKKIKFENLLNMKSAEVSVALLPLLQKQIQVSSVTLIEPDIQIEIMQDGAPSWITDKIAKAKEVSSVTPDELKAGVSNASSKALESITLDQLEIEGGKLAFINHATGVQYKAQDIDLNLSASSLKGPFKGDGSAVYDGKKVTLNLQTGKLPKGDEALEVKASIALPEVDASVSFDGVAALKKPYDIQGQTNIDLKSPDKLAAMFGAESSFDQAVSLNGLLSLDEDKVQYNDLKLSLGDFVGNGKITVENLKNKNPLQIKGSIKSSSVLDIDALMPKDKKAKPQTVNDDLKEVSRGKPKSTQKSFVPQTLTLPMSINADIQFDVGGIKVRGQKIKGAFLDLKKDGSEIKASFKALELPGQGKVDGKTNISYTSSSESPKSGQVTYADPKVTYAVKGQVGQLATFLKAFVPDADTSAVTKLYQTAQFDLNGKVNGNAISLKDSTLKLDQMVVGLGGRYEPATSGKRGKAVIDVSAGDVDFDKIMQTQGSKKAAANDNNGGSQKSAKEAVKPLQGFSLPLDLTFDVSLQRARINQADLNGLRLTGDLIGKQLQLKTASVNDFAGAAISLKGQITNLSDLSGLDLTLYTKTSDVQKLAGALKVDTSKLPKALKALEVNVSGKGSVKSLGFDAKIKSMGGQLDAAGNATDILGTPSFNNLSIGLNHPNLVQAIQVISPDFKGQTGLQQAINLRTQASVNGKKIDLSNMTVKLGKSDFTGNLKIDSSNTVTSVRGNIQAGKIALDDLLGAKTTSKKSSGSGSGGSSSKSTSSSTRWSKSSIDLAWMNKLDVDVALSASSLTYGAWNLTKPSVPLKIGNGQMSVNGMTAGVFGGQINLTTEVKSAPVSLSLTSDMKDINLEKLANALSGSGKLKSTGTVSFDVDVKSVGGSAHALVNALNGDANLNGTNVVLKGFDLAKLARGLAVEEKLATSVSSLIDGATSGGQTKFDTVRGGYKITKGTVNISSMVMDGEAAVINSTGYADLPKWFINVDNEITLKQVTDLKPINVKIKGPIDNPSDTFGKNILEDYLGAKLKRKLAKELPDILGDDVTDKLEKFGIIPKQQVPTPAPASVEDGESVPAEPQSVAPQPAPAPKKIEKPEDALKELLKGDNPEDAINNVIKGLF